MIFVAAIAAFAVLCAVLTLDTARAIRASQPVSKTERFTHEEIEKILGDDEAQ